MKSKLFFLAILLAILCICSIAFAQEPPTHEEITLTTYYPAPYGEYNSLSVGDPTAGYTATNDGELLVQGNVGIGTTSPVRKLDIDGGVHLRSDAQTQRTYFPPLAGQDADGLYFRSDSSFANQAANAGIFLKRLAFNDAPGSANDITEKVGLWLGGFHDNSGAGVPIYLGGFLYNADTPAVTIESGGNVGIGTTGPNYALDVVSTIRTNGQLRITGNNPGTSWSDTDLVIGDTSANRHDASISIMSATSATKIKNVSNTLSFTNWNDTDNVILKSNKAYFSGNVGIGTTSPGAKLHIENGGLKFNRPNDPDGSWGGWISFETPGSIAPTDTTTFKIVHSVGASYARLFFRTFNDDGSSKGYPLTIQHDGNVGIDDTTPTEARLVVRGGTVAGEGAYNNLSSHSSLKDNYEDVFVLAKVAQLNLKEWQYKNEVAEKIGDPNHHLSPFSDNFYTLFGLGKDEWSINAMDVAGVALRGVQELHEVIKGLKVENETLKRRVEALEGR